MKDNKNQQNLATLWAYEFTWINIDVDPQSQRVENKGEKGASDVLQSKLSSVCRIISMSPLSIM